MPTRNLTGADFDGTWGEVYEDPQTIWVHHPDADIYARIDGRAHLRVDVSLLGFDTVVDGQRDTVLAYDPGVPAAEPSRRFDVLALAQMGGGNDVVDLTGVGGAYTGDVTLEGEAGDDVLWAGTGDDRLEGGTGDDNLHGGLGADTLIGGAGLDRVRGGSGDDELDGGSSTDLIEGGGGDDTIVVRTSQAEFENLLGGSGTDTLQRDAASNGPVTLDSFSTSWSIEIVEGAGAIIEGNANANVFDFSGVTQLDVPAVDGRAGDDEITGNDEGNRFFGSGGLDTLRGFAGADELDGGIGADTLRGGQGDDTLLGDAGEDLLNGADGDDVLRGGAGPDQLIGGAGDDRVEGGAGRDQLSLDAGSDTILVAADFGADFVNDFESGIDRVDVPDGWTFTTAGFADTRLILFDATGLRMGSLDATNGHSWIAADLI